MAYGPVHEQTEGWLTMAMYVILRIINHDHVDEHTNVGVAVYGDDGVQTGYMVSGPERAIARGDLPKDSMGRSDFLRFFEHEKTLKIVEVTLGSMGHMMCKLQIREPFWTKIADEETLNRLYRDFVGRVIPDDIQSLADNEQWSPATVELATRTIDKINAATTDAEADGLIREFREFWSDHSELLF